MTMELPVWNTRAPASQNAESSNSSLPACSTRHKISLDNCDDILCFLANFGVLVCKQHCSGVVNLNKHLLEQHATPAKVRKEIIQHFAHCERIDPKDVKLPEQPAQLIQELGTPLDGLSCKTCYFLTTDKSVLRKHLKKNHQQAWKSDKSEFYESVKVQTFFRSGGLQKYFIVKPGGEDNSETLDRDQVVERQLSTWLEARKQLEKDMDVIGDAAKTDKTGWFKRVGWLEHLKDRNLAHLGYQVRLPDRNEVKLQRVAKLTEQLIEKGVKGLSTLPRETRRWLRSAQQSEIN
jgi:hypothetical protein